VSLPNPPIRYILGLAVTSVVALGTISSMTAAVGAQGPAATRPVVVARNLNNPRKIFIAPSGAIYVAEAGVGGQVKCLPPLSDPICLGLSGSIMKIAHGTRKRVVSGLVSVAGLSHTRADGPADVFVRGGTYYILIQDTTIDSKGSNALGPYGSTAGDLISSSGGRAQPKVIADLAAYEAAHNPDRGAGRGARLGDPPIDSDPYAFIPYRGGFAVADAAANDLLWINPNGRITTLAVFPTQRVTLMPTVARKIGAPNDMKSIVVQSVPTSVAVGPDGALYVGELTGIPFAPGRARIWRVVPGQNPSVYAAGFTTISDLAFAGKDLLVLEITSRGLLDANSPGALIRVAPDGRRTVIASEGLVAPTGLAVGKRSIYIANYGLFPAAGHGPHGEIVRIPR